MIRARCERRQAFVFAGIFEVYTCELQRVQIYYEMFESDGEDVFIVN